MKTFKKLLCSMLVAIMVVSSASMAFAATNSPVVAPQPVPQKEEPAKVGGVTGSKVDTSKAGNAAIGSMGTTKKTQVFVSAKIKVNGVKYNVTRVKKNAFKNCTKTTSVVLPSTLKKIDSGAFSGSKLKTITFKSSKIPTVTKGAFKGLNTSKMTIKVNKKISAKEFKKFVKAMRAAGFKGKIRQAAV